ncbi:MAG: CRISPR-associated protein Cmr1 [Pseudomonadota bacterium]|nr:CRISPR-associated protein Cmr1 [Pseudomonadota bacterium]
MMVKKTYTVRFTTPAFLGDAEQNGAWRTPPFKALLRQWWRVAAAKSHGYDSARLREAEGRLFGNAWLENNFSQSQVRLRLDRWQAGTLNQWPIPDPTVTHPKVTNPAGNPRPVGSHLYLGYGPLNFGQGNTRLKANAAIQVNEHAQLTTIFPDSLALIDIFQLIHWFGALGGRSRNGWGSFLLENSSETDALQGLDKLNQHNPILKEIARPLSECLQKDWPHALGKSENGKLLIWKTTNSFPNWRDAMKELARVKIAFRTALCFSPDRKNRVDQRHLLAYPVTHHNFNPWGTKSRIANQLRFKVIIENQQWVGIAYHLPCAISGELLNALLPNDRKWINQQQLSTWQTVHQKLDAEMQRI